MSLTVAAIRYTDDLPAMRDFLELLGLSPAVVSSGWIDLHAGAGRVWLHAAGNADSPSTPGQTNLCFETTDLPGLAERLGTNYVDETFGASLLITDPLGDTVQINSRHTDTYGYESLQPRPDLQTSAVAVRFTDPAGPYVPFLQTLGLRRSVSTSNADYAEFSAGAGIVGLHAAGPDTGDGIRATGAHVAVVQLALSTTRDLDAIAETLRNGGHGDAYVVAEGSQRSLHVTDPDGQSLEIHPA